VTRADLGLPEVDKAMPAGDTVVDEKGAFDANSITSTSQIQVVVDKDPDAQTSMKAIEDAECGAGIFPPRGDLNSPTATDTTDTACHETSHSFVEGHTYTAVASDGGTPRDATDDAGVLQSTDASISSQPEATIVALQTLRGSFALKRATTATKLHASNRKLATDDTGKDDYKEERMTERPTIDGPEREHENRPRSHRGEATLDRTPRGSGVTMKLAPMMTPPSAIASTSKRRIMSLKPYRLQATRPRTRLADILDGDTGTSCKADARAAISGTTAPPIKRTLRVHSLWSKVRRNHRNDLMSTQKIPTVVEQWWREPPSMSEILGDLRRSLVRSGSRDPRRV
jgi:hypothetical protein